MAKRDPWYSDGLRFACTQCGHCCTMEGYVWVSHPEALRLAEHLELSLDEFERSYVRFLNGRRALTDRTDGACVFWDEGCTVYPVRPKQCSTFPFWKENLATPASWRETAERCEGISDGPLYPVAEIGRVLRGEAATGPALERKCEENDPA